MYNSIASECAVLEQYRLHIYIHAHTRGLEGEMEKKHKKYEKCDFWEKTFICTFEMRRLFPSKTSLPDTPLHLFGCVFISISTHNSCTAAPYLKGSSDTDVAEYFSPPCS